MKRFFKALVFTFITFTICQENLIQLVDDQGNKSYFPESFVEQNEVMRDFMYDVPFAETYLLPQKIPIKKVNELYVDSLLDFENIPLRTLADHFVYADKLGNETLRAKLKQLIFEKLQNPMVDNSDAQYAREILAFYLAKSPEEAENIEAAFLLENTNTLHKNLDPSVFRNILLKQFKQRGSQHQNLNVIFTLPQTDQTSILSDYSITKNLKGTYLAFTQYLSSSSYDFWYLDNFYWKINTFLIWDLFNRFSYDQIYRFSYDNNYKVIVFAVPGKLLIAPPPFYYNLPDTIARFLSSRLAQETYKPQILQLTSIKSNAICSHIAFSYDNKKLSIIVDNKPYIIDIATKKIRPVNISTDIFSSILISDSILLVRTTKGNTYAYDLVTNQLTHLPNVDIDYFTVCYQQEDNRVLVLGLRQSTDALENIIIDNASEYINLTTLGEV